MAEALREAQRRTATSKFEAFQEQYKYDPQAFVHDIVGFSGLQRSGPAEWQDECLGLLPEKKRLAIRGPHGIGKCLGWDEKIQLASGDWVKASDLIGAQVRLPSVSRDLEPLIADALVTDNGIQETVRITTGRGREIIRTVNHPLWADHSPYRWDGEAYAKRLRPIGQWVKAGELKPGAVVAIASTSVPYNCAEASVAEIKLAAYLIGDGGTSGQGVLFTNSDSEIVEDFARACDTLGCRLRQYEDDSIAYRVIAKDSAARHWNQMPINPVIELVRAWGLAGKTAHEKAFPSWVWRLPRPQLALFLSRLYACDGWASVSNEGAREIGYATVSDDLARDVSRALLRLGINANLSTKKTSWEYEGVVKHGYCHQITINDSAGCLDFIERIGIFSKGNATDELAATCLQASPDKTQKWRRHGLPPGYHWEKIKSVEPLGYQRTVAITVPGTHTFVTEFVEHNSAFAAWVALWAILTEDDCKVPTTASAWRHLTKFLWPEIHKWAPRLDWRKIGREPFTTNELMKRSLARLPTCEAFAVASNNPAFIEGAHALRIVYVYDEAKQVPGETFNASEGAFAGAGEDTAAEAFAVAISTPGAPQGRFYDIHKRKRGYEDWHAYHVTREDAIKSGLMSREWAEQRKRQWGKDSALYLNRVCGEFAESEEDVVIPLSWVEAAVERWLEWQDQGAPDPQGMRVLGVDIARYGDDKSAIAERIGHTLTDLDKWGKTGTMASAGRVKSVLGKDQANIDVIGVGAGVVDRLLEQGCDVTGVDFRSGTDRMDRTDTFEFINVRAAAYWNLRELLDPDSEDDPVLLVDDPDLIGDLTTAKWTRTSAGKIKVESKKDIRKRLQHSPDVGDAVVLSFWEENVGWTWRG